MKYALTMVLAVLAAATAIQAAATLDIVETAGDGYTITAVSVETPSLQYWRCKVDAASGCVYSFVDLTDEGDGAGGHVDYMGNEGYNRKCSLIQFYGRGTHVFSRQAVNLTDLTAHLSFAAAADGSSFTITYAEDATSAAFFQNLYGSDANALTPGDLLTTITVTIRPPTEDGTFWDWTITEQNVSDHGIDPRVWAKQEVRSYIDGAIAKTLDSDISDINGAWNPAAPVSFGRFTIDANTAGLTAGRQFIIDYVEDLETLKQGNAVSTSSWAGFDFIQYKAPYDTPPSNILPAGAAHAEAGQFIIDICSGFVPGAPDADAGADQVVSDDDRSGAEQITLDGSGSTDPDGTIVSYTWTENGTELATGAAPVVSLPIGEHEITLTVVDDSGLSDTDTVTVAVTDPDVHIPPVADAGDDRNITDADDNGSQDVTLDGSGSTDDDGVIVSYVWTESGTEIATGVAPTVTLGVGAHTLTLTVTDDDGDTDADTVTITVIDPTPNLLTLPQMDPDCDLPESLPVDTTSTQLYNTYGQTITGSRPMELVWPQTAGEADICLYADDKFAAASVTIDDMNRPDHDWWIAQTQLHDFKVTWFIIPSKLADYTGTSSSIDLYGYWSTFEALHDLGHDVQSHSMTHTDNQHLETTCFLHYEYGVSQQLIDQYVPGAQCLTMAYPWGEGRDCVAAQYYIACRGVVGGTNIPFQTDYMRTRCAGVSVRPTTDILLTGSGDLSWSNSIYKRGWGVFLFHGVADYASTAADLAYMVSFRDQIWIDTFNTIAIYGQERDTATLTVTEATDQRIAFTLTDRMMDSIYHYPLTVKVRLFDGWTDVTATQGGQPIEATVIAHDGANYALVKAAPDQGDVLLTPAAGLLPGDANGDGAVNIDDFVIPKNNFGAADADWSRGDFNGDGAVNIDDFVILKNNFGASR